MSDIDNGKDILEFVDLVPMLLARGSVDTIQSLNYIYNKKLYQSAAECSATFSLFARTEGIIFKYYRLGALLSGPNQLDYLRRNLKEEMLKYMRLHSQYFQEEYALTQYAGDGDPFYSVKFPEKCSNKFQYLFDVINELSKEMKWNRSEFFMDISLLPFICEYNKVHYAEDELAIILESRNPSNAKKLVYKQKSEAEYEAAKRRNSQKNAKYNIHQ